MTRTTAATEFATTAREAVDALVDFLPLSPRLEATPWPITGDVPPEAAAAMVASFVGSRSVDVALVLVGPGALDRVPEAGRVEQGDILRPALEHSAAAFGVGVLSEATGADVAGLFTDPESHIFELFSAGVHAGWYVMRQRPMVSTTAGNDAILGKLSRINNVWMTLTVEIGRTRMSVRDVLGMEPGTVVELDRAVGDHADVLLNGRVIAHGEVVVVDQNYAVRVTRILDSIDAAR